MTKVSKEAEVLEFVREARDTGTPFEIVGGGTRRGVGRPMGGLPLLDVSGLTGIVKYEPEELILTVQPGTRLAEIKAVLAAKNQCLGFDPAAWTFFRPASAGPGGPAEEMLSVRETATIGGAVSADASGSGRLRHGAARDSLLGFRAVNGLGEAFSAGGKVVKNVTGFDLPKLVCGAFGTLGVLTELTFRVYPKPRHSATIALRGVTPDEGFAALRKVWHSALEPTGLGFLPEEGGPAHEDGVALIRFEAAEHPLREKCAAAKILLGAGEEIRAGDDLFAGLSEGGLFTASDLDIWRIFLPPSEAAKTATALGSSLWYGDWAGGLLWAGISGEEAGRVRAVAHAAGGHAMLMRAPAERRAKLSMFAPKPAALEVITAKVRAAFDPLSLFNPGRL